MSIACWATIRLSLEFSSSEALSRLSSVTRHAAISGFPPVGWWLGNPRAPERQSPPACRCQPLENPGYLRLRISSLLLLSDLLWLFLQDCLI